METKGRRITEETINVDVDVGEILGNIYDKWVPTGLDHIGAAKNIYQEGMKQLHGLLESSEPDDYSRGETIRPSWFLLNQKAGFCEAMNC